MPPKGRKQPDPDFVQGVMERFVREFPAAVLVGGWAAYLHTGGAKSHDIDVIVDLPTFGALGSRYTLVPSAHVGGRKFQTEVEGVEVDVYPVHQSRLGAFLHVPVEVLLERSELVSGVRVLSLEALFVAKMAALLDRPDSLPGEKDRQEMVRLLTAPAEGLAFDTVAEILTESGWAPVELDAVLDRAFTLLEESEFATSRLRSQLRKWAVQAKAAIGAPLPDTISQDDATLRRAGPQNLDRRSGQKRAR